MGGREKKVGPDLAGAGDKFDRAGLVRAVLEPSADILPGYEAVAVVTTSGNVLSGVIRAADDRSLELVAADGKSTRVARDEIEELRVSRESLMPERLHAAMPPADFADLIAYLATLRRPPPGAAGPENPEVIPRATAPLALTPFLGPDAGIRRPVWLASLAGRPDEFLVAEIDPAQIWRIGPDSDGRRKSLFVDLHGQTRQGYIEGLLGVALHPRFEANRKYYVAMHDPAANRVAVDVWERTANEDGTADSGQAPRKLLAVETPHVNHNGCCLEFGPDGYLYLSFGDGGPQEDPNGYAQSLSSLLGKILRIDVDRRDGDAPYSIPPDNPFVGKDGRPEVWALGFREPWRFTFDRKTGDLWVGDVGQGRFEEVAVVKAGENHGWNVVEGFEPFSPRYRREGATYVPPVLSYSHRHGVSVTGGYVYRGDEAPFMSGTYVFGDYETRKIWGVRREGGKAVGLVELGRSPSRIAAFGQDADGELYLLGHDPGAAYRVDLRGVNPAPTRATELLGTSEQDAGVLWRHTKAPPGDGWERPGFDDGSWRESVGGFGTRGTPGAVVRTEWRTGDIWLRREFALDERAIGDGRAVPVLRIHHDEDAEVYLNGVLAARPRGWVNSYVEIPIEPAALRALRAGRNLIAVHCHQNGGGQYVDAGLVAYPAAGRP